MNESLSKATAPNAAMALWLTVEDQWHRVTDLERCLHGAMIRSLALFLISISVGCAAEAHRTNNVVHLRATVQDVVKLSRFSGTVTPVDVDPRFALTVRIESCTPNITDFAAGSVVTFAIHSPSRLFAGEDAKGKTYDFSMRRENQNGKLRFIGLEIRTKQAKPLRRSACKGSQR